MHWPPTASFENDIGTIYDVTIRGTVTPHLLARVVRVLTWQGTMPHRLDYRADGAHVSILFSVDTNPWRMVRLLAHFRRIQGVVSAVAYDSSLGQPPDVADSVAPAAR